jgi:recombination associated protein RdgC
MLFRNLTFFRFAKAAAASLEDGLPKRLKKHALKPCGPTEPQSFGWVSPFGRGEQELMHQVGAYLLLSLGAEHKLLPPAVVQEHVAGKVAELEAERGRPVRGRERKRLKDEALTDLLPRAFVKPSRLAAYLDVRRGWIAVDAASRKSAENFVSVLRETLDSFPAVPLDPGESPRAVMTGWLTGSKLPTGFEIGDECELRDPADRGAVVRCQRQALDGDEIREHLKSGKQVARLALNVDQRVSFVLGEDLTLRKIRFLDLAVEELEGTERESAREELDARFALSTLTFEPVLERLEDVFRLNRPRERSVR